MLWLQPKTLNPSWGACGWVLWLGHGGKVAGMLWVQA